jgi:hypothetical protein
VSDSMWGAGSAVKAPTDTASQHGYSMADAIWRFAANPEDGRHFLVLNAHASIRSGADDQVLTLEELTDFEALRIFLEDSLVRRLVRGEMTAHWHPPGNGPADLQAIPATWWIGARVDSRKGEAFSHGDLVTKLLIRPAVAPLETETPPPEAWTSDRVQEWFKTRVAQFAPAPRHPTEAEDLAAARQQFSGISREIIRSFRNEYVSPERRKQGRV